MKLVCEVQMRSQLCPSKAKKGCSCTLALCKDKDKDPVLMVCSKQNLAGHKYKLKCLQKVFAKFAGQGIATLSFTEPPHDLYLKKADPLQLRSFLHFLSNLDKQDLRFSAPPSRVETPVPKKLVVTRRGDLPQSFPRTLETLSITGLGLIKFLPSIGRLKHLTTLDLSSNAIESLPVPLFEELKLRQLSLANNKLKSLTSLGSAVQSLQYLDLSANLLEYLPDDICQFCVLLELNVSHNSLARLPECFGKLKSLKVFKAASNKIEVLPSSFMNLYLLEMLDLFDNPLSQQCTSPISSSVRLPSLLEWAAQTILQERLPVSSECLPQSLLSYLERQHQYCSVCVRPVCSSQSPAVVLVNLKLLSHAVTAVDTKGRTLVPVQVTKCLAHAQKRLSTRFT